MKKFLLTILPLVAVLFLGACSDGDGDGDGAKQYSLTVNVTLPETIDWADVTSESVIARNQLTGAEFTASKISALSSITAGTFPAPTPSAGFPEE